MTPAPLTSPPSTPNQPGSSPASSLPWAQSLSQAPFKPGVYWFLDANQKILYVGKANKLRSRLRSYTQPFPPQSKTAKLVTTAQSIKWQELPSPFWAILTEAELIQKHQPEFNILLKDDKSPLYLVITNDSFPVLKLARKKQLTTIYRDLSPTKHFFGPFSSATTARYVLKTTRSIFKYCSKPGNANNQACFYYHLKLCSGACVGTISQPEYQQTILALKRFLRGNNTATRKYLKSQIKTHSDHLEFEQAQHFKLILDSIEELNQIKTQPIFDSPLPNLIEDHHQAALSEASHLLHLHGVLPANFPLHRIEGYDISNTANRLATASMVVFIDGTPAPDQYRKFRIKFTSSGGDPAMIQEALSRRLNHPDWPYPDLFLIDGGKTQLNAAYQLIQGKIPTISLVKRPDRILLKTTTGFMALRLSAHPLAATLFQQIRDESHRFAKTYHQHLRSKNLLTPT